MNLPFLQMFLFEQYSPSTQAPLHVFLLGILQVFSPVLEDSLQTVSGFWLEQSEVEEQDTENYSNFNLCVLLKIIILPILVFFTLHLLL